MRLMGVCALSAGVVVGGMSVPARASLTLLSGPQQGTHVGNLVVNGSFEAGAPAPGFANQLFWATGTSNTPFGVPGGWTSSGASSTYALWGGDGISGQGINFSAPLTDGSAGLYF